MKACLGFNPFVLSVACIVVAGSLAAAHTPQGPPKPKPANPPKPPAKVASFSPSNATPLFVTPSFMRMNHADFIVDLAAQVQGGKAQLADLAKFVGPEIAQSIVSINLKPLREKIKLNLPTSGSSTPPRVDYSDVTSSGAPIATLPGSAYSPHRIDHSELRTGQTATSVLAFTNMYKGAITAKFDDSFSGSASVTMLATYTGTEQPSTSGAMEPVVDHYVNSGGPIAAVAGQDCRVFVRFKFAKAGKYKCKLLVSCNAVTPWSVSVPVEMTVTEMGNTTVTAFADKGVIDVDSIGQTHDLPITIETTAYKSPFTVDISAKSLPAGISADSVKVNVDHAGKTQATLKVRGGPAGIDVESGLSKANEMVFTVAAGDAAKTTMKSLVCCILGRIEYDYPDQNSGGSTWSHGFIQMAADGGFFLGGHYSQSYTFYASNDYIGVAYATNQTSGNGFVIGVLPGGAIPVFWPTFGTSTWIRDHWQTCLRQGPSAFFFETTDPLPSTGNPNHPTTVTYPTSPPFVITLWW